MLGTWDQSNQPPYPLSLSPVPSPTSLMTTLSLLPPAPHLPSIPLTLSPTSPMTTLSQPLLLKGYITTSPAIRAISPSSLMIFIWDTLRVSRSLNLKRWSSGKYTMNRPSLSPMRIRSGLTTAALRAFFRTSSCCVLYISRQPNIGV